MAHINDELLERIERKLGISERRAYEVIAAKAGETHLPRHLAAIALAAELGINVNKKSYATDDERAQIRAASGNGGPPRVERPITVQAPTRARSTRTGTRRKTPIRKSNAVMVVHGRNVALRKAMYSFLRALALEPLEWTQAIKATKKGAPHNREIVNELFRQAAAVVVLLTPDDEARLKKEFLKPSDGNHERELTGQARPNVLFEAGRAFGSHPDSTILVQVGEVRPFSDTAGIHIVHIGNDAESRRDLANRLESAGCAVNTDGTDWLSEGDFTLETPLTGRRRKRGDKE